MKPTFLLAVCLFVLSVPSLQAAPTVYEQLCQMNRYWLDHPSSDPYLQQTFSFDNHEQLIRLHLMTVENTLSHSSVRHLNAEQRANRAHCLSILRDYWQAGVFPQNTYHSVTIPYFIDRYNTACAVGHLIRETGNEAFACRIADEMNYAYIAQMPYSEIPEWANKMGFSVAELKWIQPAYAPPLTISTQANAATCHHSDGSITATVTQNWVGGEQVTPDNVRWYAIHNNTMGIIGNTQNISNLQAGLYKMRIDGGGGMYAYIEKVTPISDADAPQITANIQHETCMGNRDGRIEIAISGGVAPYNVVWYNEFGNVIGNGTALENLAGWQSSMSMMYEMPTPVHIAEVTDANGCKRLESYQVETLYMNDTPYAWASTTQPTCGNNNGTINLQYIPAGHSIAWAHDPNLNAATLNNLAPGHYVFTITNPMGCTYQSFADLYHADAYTSDIYSTIQVGGDYCGQNMGYIQCPEGYTYQWSHNANLNTATANNLGEGYYTVTLSNSNGCQLLYTAYISNYEGIYYNDNVQLVNANTQTGQLGSINLNTDLMEYTYAWSHDANLTNSSADNLVAGTYSVTMTGLNNCSRVLSFAIYDESTLLSNIGTPDFAIRLNVLQLDKQLHISYPSDSPIDHAVFSLYDLNGRQIAQQVAATTETILPIDQVSTGIYLLQLRGEKLQQSLKIWVR
jgi:hypothetical protein